MKERTNFGGLIFDLYVLTYSIPRSPYGETGGYNNFQDRYEV